MSRLRTQERTQESRKLRNLQNSKQKTFIFKKKRFAGEFLKERLSKCPSVDVEDTEKEQP